MIVPQYNARTSLLHFRVQPLSWIYHVVEAKDVFLDLMVRNLLTILCNSQHRTTVKF